MSNDLTLALKIKADLEKAVKNVNRFTAELERTKNKSDSAGKQASTAGDNFRKLGNEAEKATSKLGKTRAGVESISKQLSAFKTQVIALASLGHISLGVQGIAQTADEYRNYAARIKLVSRSNTEAEATFRGLMEVANDTGQLFNATAELYTRTTRALGAAANSAEVLAFTKTINQAVVVSGAGAQEAAAALIQLSQGMASGVLRGEEFNSVSEQTPIILEMLQKSLGKTRGELRKMAEEGKLTTEVIMTAIKENAASIQEQYDNMPKTISRSVNELSNAWMQFVGNADNAMSASNIVATAISALAISLDGLGSMIVFVGGVWLIRLVSNLTMATVAFSRNALAAKGNTATLIARTTIEQRAAASALAMAKTIDKQTLATQRLTMAERQLALAKKASAAGAKVAPATAGGARAMASAGLAFLGGPLGAAITAAWGLYSVISYLRNQERELEEQYKQTVTTLEANIDKTEGLNEARKRLGEIGGFSERAEQTNINTKALDEAKQKLDELIAKRDELQAQRNADAFGYMAFNTEKIDAYNARIDELTAKMAELSKENDVLSEEVRNQLSAAFAKAVEEGGELAEKLKAIGDPSHADAVKLLLPVIKNAETDLAGMRAEAETLESKLRNELSEATQTAAQRMEAFKQKVEETARKAGLSAQQYSPLIAVLNNVLNLQTQIAQAKDAKAGGDFMDGLRKQARQSSMSQLERNLDNVNGDNRLTADQKKEAEALYRQIDANQKAQQAAAKAGREIAKQKSKAARAAANEAKKDAKEQAQLAKDAANKVHDLNSDYLRLTGQSVKADLLDMQSRYNQMLALFKKANNQEGVSLVEKMLPLEEAKIKLSAIEEEIANVMQRQKEREQQIQAQVDVGIITHLEGQEQLKATYEETTQELEKQVSLLEKMAQQPGVQGEAAQAKLDQLKLQLLELKNTSNELEKAFKNGLTDGIQTALTGLAKGTMTLADAVRSFAQVVVDAMMQVAAQQIAQQASSWVSGAFSAAASSYGGGMNYAQAFATGGQVVGPGTGTSDSIPARLSNGEFVVRAASVRKYGVGFLHAINRGHLRKYASGGLVSSPALPSTNSPGLTQAMRDGTAGKITVQASPVSIKQTLAVDSAELFKAGINSVAGQRSVLTVIRNNKQTIKQDLS